MALRNETGRINQKRRHARRDRPGRRGADRHRPGCHHAGDRQGRAGVRGHGLPDFPDLPSLLQEAVAGQLTTPAEALASVALAPRSGRAHRGCHRAPAAPRPGPAGGGPYHDRRHGHPARDRRRRPALRTGLIEHALEPLAGTLGATDPAALAQLKLDLAVVVSAEALFSLTDLYQIDPDDAVASIVHTAVTLTRAAMAGPGSQREGQP